jgi:hypothetical protein
MWFGMSPEQTIPLISVKTKQALASCFGQITDKTFDEDTIRTLLIVSREYLEGSCILKELAHFMAHPVRDRGLCHAKVNNRYAKFRLVDDQFHKFGNRSAISEIQNQQELSDFMLGGVDVNKIEAKLFEVLYFAGIDDISEKHLIRYCGMKRKNALKLLRSQYSKKDGFYHLVTDRFKDELDRLQRVIRGTIEYRSVFEHRDLVREIDVEFRRLISIFSLPSTLIPGITSNRNDIALCVMTLLHDAIFTFFDGNNARSFMCFYLEPPRDKKIDITEYFNADNMQQHGTIALYITCGYYDKKNSFPLFVSDLKIQDYFDFSSVTESIDRYNMNEVPWTTARRVDGKLKLVRTS